MAEQSDSEDDAVKAKRCRLHKRRISLTDSDTESEHGTKSGLAGSRSSERIRSKKSRIFSMPTRDDDYSGTSTNYRKLTPKKLVNDFTRINNRYNSENIDVFEDSSMSDFIVDSTDQSETSTSDSDNEKPHRVKNLLKRRSRNKIVENDTSSDSDEEFTKKEEFTEKEEFTKTETVINPQSPTDSNTNGDSNKNQDCSSDIETQATRDTEFRRGSTSDLSSEKRSEDHCAGHKKCHDQSSDSKSNETVKSDSEKSNSSSDDEVIKVVRKRQLSTSLLDSDESGSEGKSSSGGYHFRQIKTVEKRNLLFKNLKEARAKHSKPKS